MSSNFDYEEYRYGVCKFAITVAVVFAVMVLGFPPAVYFYAMWLRYWGI